LEEVAKLFPQLEILAFIGKGGMGAVYKARQPELDRLVALKILPPQAAGGAGFAERFNREARALAKLNHPNIVAVHEFGQAGGSPFFIMEFVDGLTLRQLEQAGRLSPGEALRIVPQICEALQFAHDAGIVHRDVKPENILIDKKGRVKIADFGIAKIIGGGEGWSGMTGTRQAMGTPHYMAPEQLEKPQTVDHRADIFSLGVVFYEMLTGQLPLGRFAPPSKKVEIDARLDEVVLRSLEREPELRYQQAGEVKTEIDTIASTPPGTPLEAGAAGRGSGGSPGQSRLTFARAAGALVGGACAGFLIAAAIIAFSPKTHRAETQVLFKDATGRSFLQSQAAVVTSDAVMWQAAVHLPEWIRKNLSDEVRVSRLSDEAVAGRLKRAVAVEALNGTDILAIRASAKTSDEAVVIVLNVRSALFGLNDGVSRTLIEEATALPDPSPAGWLAAGAGLGLLLGLALVLALVGKDWFGRRFAQDRPKRSTSQADPDSHARVFAWLALGFFIAALLGWPLLMAIDPTHGAALVSSALCLLLALVFGLISWHERIGRVVAIVTMGLAAVVALAAVVSLLRHQTSLFTDVLKDRDSTIQRPEQRDTKLDRAAPGVSKSAAIASAAGKNSAGFVEYSVNKTWAELGDMFDLSSPEKAAASIGIHAIGDMDLATLCNQTVFGSSNLPEGSLKLTVPPETVAEIPQNIVAEVIRYKDEVAGVIVWKPITKKFITEVFAPDDGKWKIIGDDGLDFTLTKEASVRQFEKEAENLRRKIHTLTNAPQTDLASGAGALSNGIVQMGGALGQAMQQIQNGLIGPQAAGMSNALAQMGGGLGQAMQQMQKGAQGAPINGLSGGMMQMGDALQGIQKNMIDMQIQAIKNGAGGSSGSFSVGNPFGGPPLSIQWSRNGTNLTITTNQ
jgi:predicted Ser/Thr protein kinase